MSWYSSKVTVNFSNEFDREKFKESVHWSIATVSPWRLQVSEFAEIFKIWNEKIGIKCSLKNGSFSSKQNIFGLMTILMAHPMVVTGQIGATQLESKIK